MAGDVSRSTADAAPSTQAAGAALPARRPSRAERARRTAYRGRFAAFYLVLAAIAAAAVVTTIALVGRGSPAPAPPWSDWRPEGNPERRVVQIGQHVAAPYRLPSGSRLATVTYAGPPTVTGPDGTSFRVGAIAVQASGQVTSEDDVSAFPAGSTVMYTLCGLGTNCSIAEGESTVERGALLRREALELALYTFKYVGGGVDSVLVLLPPRSDGRAAAAVFLERSDVGRELTHPVSGTLTAPLTPGVGEIPPDELQTVERITRPRLYQYSYVQAQDGSPVMVLAPALGS
jgi:hypothetical protein